MTKLTERLQEINLEFDQYNLCLRILKYQGYNEAQASSIILQFGSKTSLDDLLKNHSLLIENNFTHQYIADFLSYSDAAERLAFLLQFLKELLVNFSSAQITQISDCLEGLTNLTYIKNNVSTFKKLGFNAHQMTQFMSGNFGCDNADSLLPNMPFFKDRGFDSNTLTQLATGVFGAQNVYSKLNEINYNIFGANLMSRLQSSLNPAPPTATLPASSQPPAQRVQTPRKKPKLTTEGSEGEPRLTLSK